ncbi:uncharacterized protein O9250_016110 [Rhynochetos jubatus]
MLLNSRRCHQMKRPFVGPVIAARGAGSRNQEWTTAAHLGSAHPPPTHWTERLKGRPHGESEDHLLPMLCLLMTIINQVFKASLKRRSTRSCELDPFEWCV